MDDSRFFRSGKERTGTRRLIAATFLTLFLLSSGCGTKASSSGTLSSAAQSGPETATVDFFAMNTYMTITCYGPQAKAAADAGEAVVYTLENELSRVIAESDISRISNNSGKGPVTVSQETFDLVSDAVQYSDKTLGAFDITIAPIMDIWGFGDGNYRVPSDA